MLFKALAWETSSVFAGARDARLTYLRRAGWFEDLKGEEFRSLYQARTLQARNARAVARAPWR